MTVFSVAVHKPNKDQSDRLSAMFKEEGYGWWHWIEGYWLVSKSGADAMDIRALVKRVIPRANVLVIEVPADSRWAGSGITRGDKSMFGWLRRHLPGRG